MSLIAGILFGPWCCLALAAGALTLSGIILAAGELAIRIDRRRQDREWAAEAAQRVRAAEYPHWLEGQFAAEEAARD